MYAPFVKGALDGMEDSWEAGISTVEGDIYIEKSVRGGGGRCDRAAPEQPVVVSRPGWTGGDWQDDRQQASTANAPAHTGRAQADCFKIIGWAQLQ